MWNVVPPTQNGLFGNSVLEGQRSTPANTLHKPYRGFCGTLSLPHKMASLAYNPYDMLGEPRAGHTRMHYQTIRFLESGGVSGGPLGPIPVVLLFICCGVPTQTCVTRHKPKTGPPQRHTSPKQALRIICKPPPIFGLQRRNFGGGSGLLNITRG